MKWERFFGFSEKRCQINVKCHHSENFSNYRECHSNEQNFSLSDRFGNSAVWIWARAHDQGTPEAVENCYIWIKVNVNYIYSGYDPPCVTMKDFETLDRQINSGDEREKTFDYNRSEEARKLIHKERSFAIAPVDMLLPNTRTKSTFVRGGTITDLTFISQCLAIEEFCQNNNIYKVYRALLDTSWLPDVDRIRELIRHYFPWSTRVLASIRSVTILDHLPLRVPFINVERGGVNFKLTGVITHG